MSGVAATSLLSIIKFFLFRFLWWRLQSIRDCHIMSSGWSFVHPDGIRSVSGLSLYELLVEVFTKKCCCTCYFPAVIGEVSLKSSLSAKVSRKNPSAFYVDRS